MQIICEIWPLNIKIKTEVVPHLEFTLQFSGSRALTLKIQNETLPSQSVVTQFFLITVQY